MIPKAARRYTLALYGAAMDKGTLNEVTRDVHNTLSILSASRDAEMFFHSPVISKQKKLSAVKELFGNVFCPLTMDFVNLLIQRGRESLLKGIFEDFVNLKKEKDGIVDVSVSTSVELNDSEKARLKEKIDAYTGLKSDMKFGLDKDIIGGFVAKINDTVLDASLKRQLERLRNKFGEGDFSLN